MISSVKARRILLRTDLCFDLTTYPPEVSEEGLEPSPSVED